MLDNAAHVEFKPSSGWQASLRLRFAVQQNRTVLVQRNHCGPLQVQKPFYPEPNGVCHVYLLHPPGGIAGGDNLTIEVSVEDHAQVLLTTPAANKFYRSNGPTAQLRQTLQLADNAILEWLPQETIVFDAARARSLTKVILGEGARFLGWDITCFGRPAAAELFANGHYHGGFEIWRNGLPQWFERTVLSDHDPLLTASFGMQGYSVLGTMVCASNVPEAVQQLRQIAQSDHANNALFAVTQMKNTLLCRYLGHHAEQARLLFTQAWQVLRPRVLNCETHVPRIWHT